MDVRPVPLNRENHSQIIHCTHDIWRWCCHVSILFIYSEKRRRRTGWHRYTQNASIWFLCLLICHQSCVQVALGYNVPLNSHYEFSLYKLHHMDKQMKLLLKLINRSKQKHEKKHQRAAVNSKGILTSRHANVELTLHVFKILIKLCQWSWARKKPLSLSVSAPAAALETCCVLQWLLLPLTLHCKWNKLNSDGVATAKTQPKQMYHILCQYPLPGEQTG